MNTNTPETLPTWVAPRLMRLNQADGTDKHVLITEGASCPGGAPTTGGGTATFSGNGGGVCGPS